MRAIFSLIALAIVYPVLGIAPCPDTLSLIRKDHPRIFLTSETIPLIKKRVQSVQKKRFETLLSLVDKSPVKLEFKLDPKKITRDKDGNYRFVPPSYMLAHVMPIGGIQAERAAFAYLMTGEKKYLEKARNQLLFSVKVYEWGLANQIPVEWNYNNFERSIVAYDWIFNELTPAERKQIASVMLDVVRELQKDGKAKFRRNIGNPAAGYYGCERLLFYNGIAFYGDGINDCEAARQLFAGINGFEKMLEFREKMSGGYGVLAHSCLYYSFGEYAFSSLRYFLAVQSAMGINEAQNWKQMRDFPGFVALNLFPGENRPLEFGLGDAFHEDNSLSFFSMKMTMRSIANLYPESADSAAYVHKMLARYFQSRLDCVADFIVPGIPYKKERKPIVVPRFAYVPTVGVAYFRSGNNKGDTFACFRAGGDTDSHAHYDQNHFTIYKSGFQALDSGTRGLNQSFHLPYYYAQSIAHNTILIDMPNEKIAPHWGPKHHGYACEEPLMDGGQNKKVIKAKVKTAETPDYSAILCDATDAYNSEKCELAEREFIHLRDDLFLVVDRVKSKKSSYRKRWLLHTQNKIDVDGNTFTASEQGGVITGTILYPADAKTVVIGGPGKEFWASGKNWELHPKHDKKYIGKLHGNWRIEISPAKDAQYDMFITLLQVSNKSDNAEKVIPAIRKGEKSLVVSLKYSGKNWNIIVPEKSGEQCKIEIVKNNL